MTKQSGLVVNYLAQNFQGLGSIPYSNTFGQTSSYFSPISFAQPMTAPV
jgi:hypothetical protein